MAEPERQEVFRRSALSRITSADELDRSLKVSTVSTWAVLIAAIALVVGFLVWSLCAVVPITVRTTGVNIDAGVLARNGALAEKVAKGSGSPINGESPDSAILCWVDEETAEKVRAKGAKAKVGEVESLSMEVLSTPMSRDEVASFFQSDYYVQELGLRDWNYLLIFRMAGELDLSDFTYESPVGEARLVPVTLTLTETSPISLALGR